MLRPGFEARICDSKEPYEGNVKDLDAKSIIGFKKYLESQKVGPKTFNELFRNTVKYHHVLYEGNAFELTTYSVGKRKHAMKALAAFSKYSGCYERWQKIRKDYQLKWTSVDSLSGFNSILKENGDFSNMIEWIKDSINMYPRFSNILKFNVLTGLRPAEAIESFNLLLHPEKSNVYLSKDGKMLEHFRFPSIFLRRTKKAFISLVNEDILNLTENCQNDIINYDKIRLTFLRNDQKFYMSYCRKIFATFLRNEVVEHEIIDLLQGRIPNSIFVRHYYRPDISKFDQIREKLTSLHNLIVD
jgi:intergrase/recombinase